MTDDSGARYDIVSGLSEDDDHLVEVPSQIHFWFSWIDHNPGSTVYNLTGVPFELIVEPHEPEPYEPPPRDDESQDDGVAGGETLGGSPLQRLLAIFAFVFVLAIGALIVVPARRSSESEEE